MKIQKKNGGGGLDGGRVGGDQGGCEWRSESFVKIPNFFFFFFFFWGGGVRMDVTSEAFVKIPPPTRPRWLPRPYMVKSRQKSSL